MKKTTLKVLAMKYLTNFEKPFSSNPTVAMKMLTGGRLLISISLIWVLKKLRKKGIDK
jgi:hypothetical protein